MEYVALFDFSPENEDELAFKKSNVLKVLNREDKNWLRAELNGREGLAPESYLQKKDDSKWFVGKFARELAEATLLAMSGKRDGVFLIRESESSPGDFTLSVLFQNQVQHFKILRDGGGKYFLWLVKFNSIDELVHYHKTASVSREQKIYLKVENQQAPPQQMETQCKALYDFESDDKKDLLFKKDDIIIVVDRLHDDWWMGEIRTPSGTRHGIFPSNYVKELHPSQ